MSNIDKMLEITSANQDLFVDLNEKDSETISGGATVTIANRTPSLVVFEMGKRKYEIYPGKEGKYLTPGGFGSIKFDEDLRSAVTSNRFKILRDGGSYEFRPKEETINPHDIKLV